MARDDDFDDRPRRRDDDLEPIGPKGPLDGLFKSNIVVLILFGLCCGIFAFIPGLIGLLTAKDPKAKSNALVVTILSGVMMAIGIASKLAGVGGNGVPGQ